MPQIRNEKEVYFIGGPLDLKKQILPYNMEVYNVVSQGSFPRSFREDVHILEDVARRVTYRLIPFAVNNVTKMETWIGIILG